MTPSSAFQALFPCTHTNVQFFHSSCCSNGTHPSSRNSSRPEARMKYSTVKSYVCHLALWHQSIILPRIVLIFFQCHQSHNILKTWKNIVQSFKCNVKMNKPFWSMHKASLWTQDKTGNISPNRLSRKLPPQMANVYNSLLSRNIPIWLNKFLHIRCAQETPELFRGFLSLVFEMWDGVHTLSCFLKDRGD